MLREAQLYVKSLDSGLTLFDLPGNAHAADLLQWDPILEWLSPTVKVPHVSRTAVVQPVSVTVVVPEEKEEGVQRMNATRAASLMPAQEGLVQGNLYAFTRPGLRDTADTPAKTRPTPNPNGAGTSQFLLRQ